MLTKPHSILMFFLDRLDLDRRFRVLRVELSQVGIEDELRGWSFESGLVKPSSSMLLSVSELASRYCPTMRDLYLRRVLRIKPPPNVKMTRGIAFHEVCRRVVHEVKKMLFETQSGVPGYEIIDRLLPDAERIADETVAEAEGRTTKLSPEDRGTLVEEAASLYKFLVIQAAAKVDQALSKYTHATSDSIINVAIPPVIERRVDGSLVGLSRELSVDIYTPYNAVADLKTGEVRSFHPYTVTGYALALEAEDNIPVNYGIITYVRVVKSVPRFKIKCFVIGNELRREFLELREEAYTILEVGRDPGRPSRCPRYCPYYPVCVGGEA